ncbi:MAG: DUF4097 family beta strand repeat-containing protein [Ignavibacteriaceae bacterium]
MFDKFTKSGVIFSLIIFSLISLACNREAYDDYNYSEDNNLKVLHEKTFKIEPGKSLRIEGSSGNIMLTTWDKPEVYIKIMGNEKAERKVRFNFDNDSDEVEVIARRDDSFFNWSSGIRIKFEVKIPSNFNPNLHTSGGDIRLAGVNGKTLAKTSGGDILARYLRGDINISTSGGDVNLESIKGNIRASTSGGDIDAIDFEGILDVSTSGGNISLDGKNAEIEATTSGGNVELRYSGENKGIELSTSGGNIRISLPADFDAYARLSSSGGSVECDFPANNIRKISANKFEADLNSGGNPLIAKTSGGSIRVRTQ